MLLWLDELEKKNAGKTISEHAEEQLQIIVDRIAFKRDTHDSEGGWTEDKVCLFLRVSSGTLLRMRPLSRWVTSSSSRTVDVEAMQGDDDGDTVVVETDLDTVQRFVDAEIFKKFYKNNGLRLLQIEMTKDNQIDFALANSVYRGTSYDQLSG